MGAAIDFLLLHGLTAKTNGQRIVVSPASKLTPNVRQYIKSHRLELLAELIAGNDAQPAPEPPQATTAISAAPTTAPAAEIRRNAWTITRGGKPICTICGAPMTYDEALDEARWRWPDAEILEN